MDVSSQESDVHNAYTIIQPIRKYVNAFTIVNVISVSIDVIFNDAYHYVRSAAIVFIMPQPCLSLWELLLS